MNFSFETPDLGPDHWQSFNGAPLERLGDERSMGKTS